MMHRCTSARTKAIQLNLSLASLALAVYLTGCSQQPQVLGKTDQATVVKNSQALVPMPPWPEGDEQGMANTLGAGTLMRCAYHLNQPNARVYELSHLRSKQMPSSPWAEPMEYEYSSTAIIPNSIIVHHPGAKVTGVSGAQGTQMDAFAHFGYLDEIWGGQGDIPIEKAKYYGGYTQAEVKPSPDLPMQKLGIDKASPIITSALLLDAKAYLGQGKPMNAGQEIHSKDLEAMVEAQGLEWRGILPGDVLYIYTGWSDYWEKDFYYHGGPGLSLDAAKYLEKKRVVLVALDNPFTDAVNLGQFSGKAKPPVGTPDEIAGAPAHYYNLTQSGIHQIQNASLAQMAADRVWTSCTVVLPVKVKGAAGAPVSPVAVGAPDE